MTAPTLKAPPACRNAKCGKPRRRRGAGDGWVGGQGYCGTCFSRWWDAGQPETGVPDPPPPGQRNTAWLEQQTAEREARLARFARCVRGGCTIPGAAAAVGISVKTGYDYSAELRRRREATRGGRAAA